MFFKKLLEESRSCNGETGDVALQACPRMPIPLAYPQALQMSRLSTVGVYSTWRMQLSEVDDIGMAIAWR